MIETGTSFGNYRVVRKLGAGAMGSVWLAEHPRIHKKVALKVIHAELADNEEMLSRFFNEARAVTRIGHQNIVEVIDFGQSPDGGNFIVMELLEGRSLGDVMKAEGVLSPERAVHIARQIAEGLDASHAHGIVHRDLKPDNVYLVERLGDPDFVKILDFGLAKLTQGGGALSHRTREGSVLGTPHYMAPEQCEGKPDIDHRVDVYALGCIVYQMLCGEVPFPGDGFGEVLVKHLREPPVVPSRKNPNVPRPLEAIVLHALAKRKEFRFQSMRELVTALDDPDRYLRELSGEAAIAASTGELEAPPIAAIRAAAQAEARRVSRPTAPLKVAKVDDAAATMLDEALPDAVQDALATEVGSARGQATVMLEAPALPAGSTARAGAAGGGPAQAARGATTAARVLPSTPRSGRTLVALVVGALVAMLAGGAALWLAPRRSSMAAARVTNEEARGAAATSAPTPERAVPSPGPPTATPPPARGSIPTDEPARIDAIPGAAPAPPADRPTAERAAASRPAASPSAPSPSRSKRQKARAGGTAREAGGTGDDILVPNF